MCVKEVWEGCLVVTCKGKLLVWGHEIVRGVAAGEG